MKLLSELELSPSCFSGCAYLPLHVLPASPVFTLCLCVTQSNTIYLFLLYLCIRVLSDVHSGAAEPRLPILKRTKAYYKVIIITITIKITKMKITKIILIHYIWRALFKNSKTLYRLKQMQSIRYKINIVICQLVCIIGAFFLHDLDNV